MSTLLAICFVIVTIAVAAIAVTTIVVMQKFRKASEEFGRLAADGREWIHQVKRVTEDAGDVVNTFQEVAPRLRRVMDRIESIGERTVDLSDAVLHEVETPVRTAVAVARGARVGALRLVELLTERFTRRSSYNGDIEYE